MIPARFGRAAAAVAVLASVMAVASPAAQAPQAAETFDAAWTIIRDSHFDPGMNGVDWDAVRAELRPKALSARSAGELRAIVREMLGRLGQSHFALIPAGSDHAPGVSGDQSGNAGLDVRLIERNVVVARVHQDGGAWRAGVQPGWIVAAIEGRAVPEIVSGLSESLPERLRQVEVWRTIEGRLRGPRGSSVQVTFRDGSDRPVTLAIRRYAESGEIAAVGNLPPMHVRLESTAVRTPAGTAAGVIAFNIWLPAIDALFQKAIDQHRSAAGIVLDLRGNPGGLAAMMMGLSGHFLGERKPLGVMKTRETELKFTANPRLVSAAGQRVEPFAGPLAILVDALTGSASECFAGGLQSLGRARVFGQPSMGQALPALFSKLPNGDVLIHAYGDFVTANGTRLEGRGVIPDEIVPLRREDLLAGRDAPLERALQWIATMGARSPGSGGAAGDRPGPG